MSATLIAKECFGFRALVISESLNDAATATIPLISPAEATILYFLKGVYINPAQSLGNPTPDRNMLLVTTTTTEYDK